MGRHRRVVTRTWKQHTRMKVQRGPLAADSSRNEQSTHKRYVAKYTINPAIAARNIARGGINRT